MSDNGNLSSDNGQSKPDPKNDMSMHGSFMQKALIIFLVIAVGIVFGFAPSMTYLMAPQQSNTMLEGGVTAKEVRQLAQTQARLMSAVMNQPYDDELAARLLSSPQVGQQMSFLFFETGLHSILRPAQSLAVMEKVAKSEGLLLTGEALKQSMRDVLAVQGLASDAGNLSAVLKAREGTAGEITTAQLQYLVQAAAAWNALSFRYSTQSAGPVSVVETINGLRNDRVVFDAVELTVAPYLEKITAELESDTAALEDAYLQLTGEGRFAIPERRSISAIIAEPVHLHDKITISDAAIAAYYESNSAEFIRPPIEGEDTETKPLDEVKSEIRTRLTVAAADEISEKLVSQFDTIISQEGLDQSETLEPVLVAARSVVVGPTQDERLSDSVSLTIHEDAVIPAAGSRLSISVGDVEHAQIDNGVLQLAEKPAGWLSNIINDANIEGRKIVFRVNSVLPESQQPLDAVRGEVLQWLAARRAWPQLYAEAVTISETLDSQGPGALAKWAEGKGGQRLQAVVIEREEAPLVRLAPPSELVDDFPAQGEPAISYVSAQADEAAVFLVNQPTRSDELALSILQVKTYRQASLDDTATPAIDPNQAIGQYQQSIGFLDSERVYDTIFSKASE